MILKKYEIEKNDNGQAEIRFYYDENDLTFDVLKYLIDVTKQVSDYNTYEKTRGVFTIYISIFNRKYQRVHHDIKYSLLKELYKNPTKCFMFHDDENPILNIFSKVMVKCFEPT